MRQFILLLFSVITFTGTYAQNQKMKEPVKWSTNIGKIDEDEFLLSFRAELEEHWHIYSQTQESDDGPLPTKITFEESEDFILLGKAEEIGDLEVVYEDVFEMNVRQYSNILTLAQKVQLTNPSASFKVIIEYMVCSDKSGQCIPFDKTFEVTLDKKKMTETR